MGMVTNSVALKKKIEITDSTFEKEVLQSKKPVLVMFWGSWCPVCKQSEPLILSLADKLVDNIKICKMNVDRNPRTAITYKVMGTPNYCVFKNGKLINQKFGALSKDQLLKLFEEL